MRLLSLRRHSPGLRVLEVQDQDGQVEATGKQIWAQLEEQSVRSKDELGDSCALTFLSPRDALVPQQCSQGAGLALSHPHFFFSARSQDSCPTLPSLQGCSQARRTIFRLHVPFFLARTILPKAPTQLPLTICTTNISRFA